MSSKRKEYKVDARAKKAALFFLACEPNPVTRLSIPAAMRAKGYSDSEAADRILVQQVRRESQKNKSNDTPRPESAAASSLLALTTVASAASSRPALRTITPNLAAAPVVTVAGMNAGILPSPERKVRKTSHQEQIGKQNESKRKVVHAQAHSRATILVAEERALPKEDRRSTAQVIAQVEGEFRARGLGATLNKNTINRYVQLGMVGTFPLSRGYEGTMPRHAFDLLVLAVESFIQISNVNSVVAERKQLIMLVNMCCGVPPAECGMKHSVFDRVMRSTNVSLNADVSPPVEERRLRWTTWSNLLNWFENFKAFLVEFDFAGVDDEGGELTFTEEQLRRIMNIDETELALNGDTHAGGRAAVSFYDPHLPIASRSVAKSSLACTGIFGSNAAGECVPPHFQLPTSATAEEREKVRYEFLTHILDTRGRFGCAEERIWPCTIGMNEKGGMTDDEFEKYIDNSIVPLYPDLEDTPGKRILLKVDSGPGRNGRELLMKCRFRGLYIYPGLPNATSVQQETDHNYGPFKGVVRDNLKKMSSAFYAAGLRIPLNTTTFGLIVYGGTIPVGPSTTITCRNALAETFDVESNLTSWREVGAVPHTRKCLTNSKVRHDGTDERDTNFDAYQDIQSQNDYSTAQLNLMGYRGDVLRAQFCPDKISERKESMAVTVANTRERQEAIAAANTHGAKFFVTGGEHVTSNDMFKAAEINRRKAEAAEREKEKKRRVEFHARRETALPIVDRLELELENDVGRLTSKELEVLLRWKGVAASKMGNVANRRLLYQQFAEGDIVEEVSIPAPWTDIDEAELVALRDAPIEMYDTAYGRFEEQKKRDVERSYQKMSAVEKEIFKKKMAEIDEADAGVDEE
jgi:hypothetical protein